MSEFTHPVSGQEVSDGAAHMVPHGTELDLETYDNQASQIGAVANINLQSAEVPAGCLRVLIGYTNAAVGNTETCFVRWGAAANTATCLRLSDGDRLILKVPLTGTRRLNLIGSIGLTGGSTLTMAPLG